MEQIFTRILENVFGPSVDNVATMLQMLSRSMGENYRLRILLKNKDVNIGNTNLDTINMIKNMDIKLYQTYDKIISNMFVSMKSQYTTFEHDMKEKTTDAIISLARLATPHYNVETGSFIFVNLFKRVPTVPYNSNVSLGYEHRLGEIYEFNDPRLSNWFVNMYSFVTSTDYFDPRLRMKNEAYKHYDGLFIEFVLKSVTPTIISDVVNLLEVFYKQEFKDVSVTYNILNKFYKVSTDLLPTTNILTQADIESDIENYRLIDCKYSRSCIIVCYQNYIYKLTENAFELLNRDQEESNNLTYAFVCKYEDGTFYEIVDCVVFDSKNRCNQPYDERMKDVEKYVNESPLLKSINATLKKVVNFEAWDDVEGSFICIKNEAEYSLTHYSIQYQKDASVYFLTRRIPYSQRYCLYVTAKGKDVINSSLYFNNYSKSHFGYTLTSIQNTGDKYALFDTPYFDNFISDIMLITDDILKKYDLMSVKPLLTDILNGTVNIDQKVCKFRCVYYDDRFYWIPLAVTNNVPASDYKYAMYVAASMYDNITFSTPSTYNIRTKDYMTINNILNRFIVEYFINKYPHENVVEVFNPEHGLITSMFSLTTTRNLIAINECSHSIIKYVTMALDAKVQKPLQPILLTTSLGSLTSYLSLKVMNYDMKRISNDINTKLLALSVFTTNCCDLVILSHNTNEVIGNVLNCINFIEMLNQTLNNRGRILLKFINDNTLSDSPKVFKCPHKAFKNDKFVTKVGNELRFKGKVYSFLKDYTENYPLITNIAYSDMPTPLLPYDKKLLQKLSYMFGAKVHFGTTIFSRVLDNYVGLSAYDESFGGIDYETYKSRYNTEIVLIADKALNGACKTEIKRRCKNNLPMLVITDDKWITSQPLTHLQNNMYISCSQNVEKLKRIDLLEFASCYKFEKDNNRLQTPYQEFFYKIFPMYNITLDEVVCPYTHNFIMNYLKSIDANLTNAEKNNLSKQCVASLNFKLRAL